MKNTVLLLLPLAFLLLVGCGRKETPPPAKAPDQGAKAVEGDDSEFDEAPGMAEESSREW